MEDLEEEIQYDDGLEGGEVGYITFALKSSLPIGGLVVFDYYKDPSENMSS